MAPATGVDCQPGRVHSPQHCRAKDQTGSVSPQNAPTRPPHREAANLFASGQVPLPSSGTRPPLCGPCPQSDRRI